MEWFQLIPSDTAIVFLAGLVTGLAAKWALKLVTALASVLVLFEILRQAGVFVL